MLRKYIIVILCILIPFVGGYLFSEVCVNVNHYPYVFIFLTGMLLTYLFGIIVLLLVSMIKDYLTNN